MNSTAQNIGPIHEGRRQPRTHLYVIATLYSGVGTTPVHIRNMSPSGALIEAAVLPDVGERISLKRGQLHATGQIAWRADRRAGVSFGALVHVADWMSRQVTSGQQRVDAIVASVRGNTSGPTGATAVSNTEPASIEAELMLLRSDLAGLEAVLVGDPIVVATHPEIQTIDISLQRIDRVMGLLRTGG